jgi:hypothetical protein
LTLSAWRSPVASLTGIRRYCTLITVLHLRPGRPAKEDGKTGYTGEGDQVIAR